MATERGLISSKRPRLIYLHGFLSSPQSAKVTELGEWLECHKVPVDLIAPQLPVSPDAAIDTVERLIETVPAGVPCGLIGSSLGGYYASVISARHRLPAVLINPAAYPYRRLNEFVGPQRSYHSGELVDVTTDHMNALKRMDTGEHPVPEKMLVMLQTGDETLDFREAAHRFEHSPKWIQPGGNHRFEDFVGKIPAILAFLWPDWFRREFSNRS